MLANFIAAIGGALIIVAMVWGAFQYGIKQCPPCHEIDRAEVLREVILPAQKLVLAQNVNVQSFNWKAASQWPSFVKWAIKKVGGNTVSKGHLQYESTFNVGYDLKDGSSWQISRNGTQIVFEPPPLQVVGCPSVLTHTFKFEVDQASFIVDEQERRPAILAAATAEALVATHRRLVADEATYRKVADAQLVAFLRSMAGPLGVKAQEIVITEKRKPANVLPETWKPKYSKDGTLDDASLNEIRKWGCGASR